MIKRKKIGKLLPLEKFGLVLSIICAIHCISLPIFLFFAPYLASSFAYNDSIEWILVISSFLLAGVLLYQDFKKHRQFQPLILLGLAVFAKLIEIFWQNKSTDWLFGVILGIFISWAYWINYKHKSTCRCKVS